MRTWPAGTCRIQILARDVCFFECGLHVSNAQSGMDWMFTESYLVTGKRGPAKTRWALVSAVEAGDMRVS